MIRTEEILGGMKQKLRNNEPLFAGRFGSNEIQLYLQYKKVSRSLLGKVARRFFYREYQEWNSKLVNFDRPEYYHAWGRMLSNKASVSYFVKETDEALEVLDILGSWRKEEEFVNKLKLKNKIPLHMLEPYYSRDPWSSELEGKKILVISPFVESIKFQYIHKRNNLFENQSVLPFFDLSFLKAPYHNDTRFSDWINLSNWYKNELVKLDFDIALLGNGCWGMTCGGFIKKYLHKSAIHLGGALQLLFGIYGNRWLDPGSRFFKAGLINNSWKRPYESEKPSYSESVEGGCYW